MDNTAYKVMVFMDILADIAPQWKQSFDCSEDMYKTLMALINEQQAQDTHAGAWYDDAVAFLNKKIKRRK